MYKKLLSTVFVVSALTGCAGTVVIPTSEGNRDVSGKYDGAWRVNVSKGISIQHIKSWRVNCGDMSHEFDITVNDGTILLSSDVAEKRSFVSSKGRFKVYLPIGGVARSSGNSDVTLDNGSRKLVLRGRLSDAKSSGYLTVGIAELGYAGCTSKTTFERVSPDLEA